LNKNIFKETWKIRFFIGTSWARKLFSSNDELHIILRVKNLQIRVPLPLWNKNNIQRDFENAFLLILVV